MSETINAHAKGSAAENIAKAALALNGYQVYAVEFPTGPCDLVAEKDNNLLRCQVKAFWKRGGRPATNAEVVDLRTAAGSERGSYHDRVDYLLAVDVNTAETFLVPLDAVVAQTQISKSQLGEYAIYPIV